MRHKPPTPPREVIRILRETLQRLETSPSTCEIASSYDEFKRSLVSRIAIVEADMAMTSRV